MADPEVVGLFRVPGDRGGGAVDLVLKAVLSAGADLGDRHGATRATLEAEGDQRDVLRSDGYGRSFGLPVGGERLHRLDGLPADRNDRGQIGQHGFDPQAGHERREIEPVGTDVGDGAQRAPIFRLEPPVPVRVVEQPILEVAAGHESNVADTAATDQLRYVLIYGVEADVEVDGVDEAARRCELDQLGRLRRGQRKRLLADDIPAGREDLLGLGIVQIVGRRDVDHANAVIAQEVVERGVGGGNAHLLRSGSAERRRGFEQSDDVDSDSPEGLDVDRADETAANHGGADVATVCHEETDYLQRPGLPWAGRVTNRRRFRVAVDRMAALESARAGPCD